MCVPYDKLSLLVVSLRVVLSKNAEEEEEEACVREHVAGFIRIQ
jgi:hypothetical protein